MAAKTPQSTASASFSNTAKKAAVVTGGLLAAGSTAYWLYGIIRRRRLGKTIGFARAEMCTEPLVMKKYQLHVFFGLGSKASSWPDHVETTTIGSVFQDASKALKSEFPSVSIKVTATDEPKGVFRVFPSSAVYRLQGGDADHPPLGLITNALQHHAAQLDFPSSSQSAFKPLDGRKVQQPQLFVCCHQERDARCGFCGPVLVEALRGELRQRGVVPRVHACSHIGGHKYAGNVLVFQDRVMKAEANRVCAGDWYGYVRPEDVPELIDAHFPATAVAVGDDGVSGQGKEAQKNGIVARLWRGGIGLSGEEIRQERRAHAAKDPVGASKSAQSCGTGCKCVSGSDSAQ